MREITILSILYPTPRVGTAAELPDEPQIGLTIKIRSDPSSVDPLAITLETHTPKLDCLIEGLRLDETDDDGTQGVFTIVEPFIKSQVSKLVFQCREMSEKLLTYANHIERLSKQQIPHIDDKIQQIIKSSQNESNVSDRHINKNNLSLVSSASSSSVSSPSASTPDLSLFEY